MATPHIASAASCRHAFLLNIIVCVSTQATIAAEQPEQYKPWREVQKALLRTKLSCAEGHFTCQERQHFPLQFQALSCAFQGNRRARLA
eukprot:1050812-Amphidinium_carterae.1